MWLESVQAYNILFAGTDNVSSALLKKIRQITRCFPYKKNKKREKAKHSGPTYKPTCARPPFNLSCHVEPPKLKCLTLFKNSFIIYFNFY